MGRSATSITSFSSHTNAIVLTFKDAIRNVIINLIVRVYRVVLVMVMMSALRGIKVIHKVSLSISYSL